MFFKNKFICCIEIFWLLLLIIFSSLVYLSHLNQNFMGFFFNSDALGATAVFKDLFLEHGHYKDWSLAPAPYFFPDIFIFLPVFLLTKNIYFQFLVALCVQLVLLYLAVKYVYYQFFQKTRATIFSLASVSIFYLMALKNIIPYNLALIVGIHVGGFIAGIFFFAMQLSVIDNINKLNCKNSLLCLIGTLLSFFTGLSDLLFVVQFSSAIFLTYFLLYIKRIIKFSAVLRYSFLPFFAAIAGALLTKYVVPVDVFPSHLDHPSLNKISFDIVQHQFFLFIDMLKTDVNWYGGILFVLFYIFIFFIIIFYSLKKNNSENFLDRKLLFLSGFVLFSITISIIAPLLLAKECYVLDRYILPVFYFPVLLFFCLTIIVNKFRLMYDGVLWLASLSILAILWSIIVLANRPGFRVNMEYYPPYMTCIDHALQRYGRYGIAHYWNARLITVLSREKLQIFPVEGPNLAIFPWIVNLKKFKNAYSFAVVDISPGDERVVELFNGKPEKVVFCSGKKLLIYPENKLRIPFFKKAGDRFTWPASTLPSQFAKSLVLNTRVVKEADGPGYVTFGPYIALPAGQYHFYITYSSSAATRMEVGYWDIATIKKDLLFEVPLFGTNSRQQQIKGIFVVQPDLSEDIFQIRTFFSGHSDLKIETLTLVKD